MAKKLTRRQRQSQTAKVSTQPPSAIQSATPIEAATNHLLIYTYPLSSIKRDLVKSLILFIIFITIVVALMTTKWF